MSDELRDSAKKRLDEIRARLAQLGAPARDQNLALLSGWLEQTIEVRRAIELGDRLSTCLLDEIVTPVGQLLAGGPEGGSVDWFAYAIRTWILTAANHRGALRDAQGQTGAMEKLLPSLAGQWEHATLLMRGLVAQGVHLTDCFEHDAASKRMEVAAKYYGELGSPFHVILPDVFPERVRSDLHGRVLGTWLQSEVLAGLGRADATRLDRARRLSEQAIDEFPARTGQEDPQSGTVGSKAPNSTAGIRTASGSPARSERCLGGSAGRCAEGSPPGRRCQPCGAGLNRPDGRRRLRSGHYGQSSMASQPWPN